MTRLARRRVRIVLIVTLFVIIAAFVTIAAILASGRRAPDPDPIIIGIVPDSHRRMRCKDDVIVSDSASQWRHLHERMPDWQQLLDLKHGGFVIVSPAVQLEQGATKGVLLSMSLPGAGVGPEN